MKQFLTDLLGAEGVLDEPARLAAYSEDQTEIEGGAPALVAFPTTTKQIQSIVHVAGQERTPITARVFGTNLGGLTVPSEGGLVLDLTRMNRVIDIDREDMVAVIEPGVSQRILKDRLTSEGIPLTLGYSLAPPDTSVFANALMGGLTNRSLKYGNQAEAISALEVVLSDGSLAQLGSWAVDGVPPFGRVPLPDLIGLFVGWQGTTGIATRMAFQLWPLHPLNRRLFFLTYTPRATFEAMRRLVRTEAVDDIGGLSWPSGKMMLGVPKPHPVLGDGEPTFFLYLDLTAEIPEEMAVKEKLVQRVIDGLRAEGERYEGPIDVSTLVKVNPAMGKFADFPTHLDFLTDHPGGGLTWIGTYGPLSRFTDAAVACGEIMMRTGLPPTIVSRPMRGGHYGVLRFVTVFDKKDPNDVARTRAVNRELLLELTNRGFLMYKTPVWAWNELKPRMDPGMLKLMGQVKHLMDPYRHFNPGKLGL